MVQGQGNSNGLGTAFALILSPVLIESHYFWTYALLIAAVLMGVGLMFFIIYMIFDARVSGGANHEQSLLDADEEFHLSDITALLKNRSYIYVILLCVTFYSAVFPFQAYCPDLLHNKFGLSIDVSGTLTSLIIWGTIVFTPLFGYFVDKKGKRASLMLIGSFLLVVVHLTLSLTSVTPYIPMFVLGIAFSLVPAAMCPSVALIVDERRLCTAYGIMASLQNLGLWAFPILAGYFLDKTNPDVTEEMLAQGATYDYTWTILMFAILGVIGLLVAWLLKREDAGAKGYGLELASTDA